MASDDPPDIETTGTRLIYENLWMRLREDRIRYRDGTIKDATTVAAFGLLRLKGLL
jgi:hypothetical protein